MNSDPPISFASRREHKASPRCDIQLQNPCRYPEAGARRLRPWLAPLIDELAPGVDSFVVRFVSDREMRRLNADFRDRDETTDVLSFPAESADLATPAARVADVPIEERHLGDVVISVPTARRQAKRLGHGVDIELRTLLLHGVLHCLGHDHETDGGVMDSLEQRLRRRYVFRSSSQGRPGDA